MVLLLCMGGAQLWAEGLDLFALPSPSEILTEAKEEGLTVVVTSESAAVLARDLEALAKENPELNAFTMGRIFAVAGYSFKDLNNSIILKMAEKVLGGAKSLELPEVVAEEIDKFYRLMVTKEKWERNELLLSFTTARASLMYLLKGTDKVPAGDRSRLDGYGVALEIGLWYQSLELATNQITEEQLEAFVYVYLDEDYLDYFQGSLARVAKSTEKPIFKSWIELNDLCLKAIEDETLDLKELEQLKSALKEVLK